MEVSPVDSELSKSPHADITAVFQNERHGLVRMATLMIGSGALAEEIVQDAFVAVEPRWSELERPGAYLRTSVVNGCAQALRRRDAERRALQSRARDEDLVLPVRLIELRAALDKLGDRQRIVIVMRYFVDIHDDEIAEILGIQPSSVRSITRRALKVLRKELS